MYGARVVGRNVYQGLNRIVVALGAELGRDRRLEREREVTGTPGARARVLRAVERDRRVAKDGAVAGDEIHRNLAVEARVGIGVRVGIRVRIGIGIGVRVGIRVRVGVGIGVRIGIRVGIGVRIGIRVGVGVRVGLARAGAVASFVAGDGACEDEREPNGSIGAHWPSNRYWDDDRTGRRPIYGMFAVPSAVKCTVSFVGTSSMTSVSDGSAMVSIESL